MRTEIIETIATQTVDVRQWQRPELKVANVKDITGAGLVSGNDGQGGGCGEELLHKNRCP